MLRESVNQKINAVIYKVPGPYWGLLSVIIGLIGDFIAFLFFKGYDLRYMVSELGVGPGGIFFNLGTILSGIFALFFYLYLAPSLKFEGVNKQIHKTAVNLSILSCCFFVCIGIFPSVRSNPFLFTSHGIFAMLSWITGIGYKTLFSLMMLKNKRFLKLHTIVGFAVVMIEITFIFTWIPLIEWLMVFAITFWISVLTIHSFQNKKEFSNLRTLK